MEKRKILIVEDNLDICDIYKILFEKEEGFELEFAHDGKVGLKKLESFGPDLVILDIMIPNLNGFGFLEEVKGKTTAKIIVNSNLSTDKDVQRALELGATDFLKKTQYDTFGLIEKIKNYLN